MIRVEKNKNKKDFVRTQKYVNMPLESGKNIGIDGKMFHHQYAGSLNPGEY